MATNIRQKKQLLIPDINILPEEYRRPAISSLSLLLIIAILLSIFGIYKLFPLRAQTISEQDSLNDQMATYQQEIKSLQPLESQAKELKDILGKLEAKKKDYLSAWDTFQKSQIKWQLILDGIQGMIPQGVSVDSIIQKDFNITVHGLAPNLNSVLEYANSLRRLGLTRDIGMTYEIQPAGNISFNLHLVIKQGVAP